MSLHVSIRPELTEEDKRELEAFLIKVLNDPLHEYGTYGDRLRCAPKLELHFNGYAHHLTAGYSQIWSIDSNTQVYIGTGTDVSISDKLAILNGLRQYLEPCSEALKEASSAALGRYLLNERNALSGGLTVSNPPATGIAFSESQVASLIDGVWMLPNGEEVDVTGEEWTVCVGEVSESVAPAAPVHHETVAQVGDAGIDTVVPTTQFYVGQRIHFQRIPVVTSVPGEAVITSIDELPDRVNIDWEGHTYYVEVRDIFPVEVIAVEAPVIASAEFVVGQRVVVTERGGILGTITSIDDWINVLCDDGEGDGFRAHHLTAVETPVAFSVGQRVRYSRIARTSLPAGTGTIRELADNYNEYSVEVDGPNPGIGTLLLRL